MPIWGKPEDGNASDKTLNTTLLSEIAQRLAQYGVQPGAYIYIADAALVTEDQRAARRDPLGLTRLPAPYRARGRGLAEAGAHPAWEEGGVLAQTPPTPPRPGTFYTVAAARGTFYGRGSRAVGGHSSRPAQRQQQPRARELQASPALLEAPGRALSQQA